LTKDCYNMPMSYPYQKAAVGGTFDHLHAGHQALIDKAFEVAEKVVIGILSLPHESNKAYFHAIESYEKRLDTVKQYIEHKYDANRAEIIQLNDAYGPTLTDTKLDCLIISKMTKKSAQELNHKRIQNRLPKLAIIEIDTQYDQAGKSISSTSIRRGKIDRKGNRYHFLFGSTLMLRNEMRHVLQEPQGELVSSISKIKMLSPHNVIGVGDLVIKELIQANLSFTHAIIDGFIEREAVGIPDHAYHFNEILHTPNPPGTITSESAKAVQQLLTSPKCLLIVNGEEDLLVFPSVLLAPLGSLVIYGQPHQGVVVIEVNETSKARIKNMMHKVFVQSIIN
jgi:cytidyltransferase-like protein